MFLCNQVLSLLSLVINSIWWYLILLHNSPLYIIWYNRKLYMWISLAFIWSNMYNKNRINFKEKSSLHWTDLQLSAQGDRNKHTHKYIHTHSLRENKVESSRILKHNNIKRNQTIDTQRKTETYTKAVIVSWILCNINNHRKLPQNTYSHTISQCHRECC